MGFRKFLKQAARGVKKLAAPIVKQAIASALPGVGSIVSSKLESFGSSRKRASLLKAPEVPLALNKAERGLTEKFSRSPARKLTAPSSKTVTRLAASDQSRRRTTAGKTALAKKRKIGKLSQDEQLTLYQTWIDQGKPGAWEDFASEVAG